MKSRLILLLTIIVSLVALTGFTLYNSHQNDDSLELNTIMRLLLLDVHTINEGIYTNNFDLIETGATAINSHPSLSDETIKRVQQTLGDQMTAFGQFDKLVHDYADSVRNAARDQDMDRVLSNYRIMEQSCVNCHVAFQDTLRLVRLNSR